MNGVPGAPCLGCVNSSRLRVSNGVSPALGTVKDEISSNFEIDRAAVSTPAPILGDDGAPGVEDEITADRKPDRTRRAAPSERRVVVALNRAVDHQVPVVHGKDAVGGAVVIVGRTVERVEGNDSAEGDVISGSAVGRKTGEWKTGLQIRTDA